MSAIIHYDSVPSLRKLKVKKCLPFSILAHPLTSMVIGQLARRLVL